MSVPPSVFNLNVAPVSKSVPDTTIVKLPEPSPVNKFDGLTLVNEGCSASKADFVIFLRTPADVSKIKRTSSLATLPIVISDLLVINPGPTTF